MSPPGLWLAREHPDRLEEAIICLLGRHRASSGEADNFLKYARDNQLNLDNLVACPQPGAAPEEPLAFAVLCATNPGRTAMLLHSPPKSRDEIFPISQLASYAISQLDREKVQLVQALVAPEDALGTETLQQTGLHELAVLHYMERPAHTPIASNSKLPENLQLQAYTQDDDEDVLTALETSYEGTLDCPGLRGLRQTKDILAGHKATGTAELNLWWVLRQEERPVGVIMLAAHKSANTLELAYLGLAPEARGRGAGSAMLAWALKTADHLLPRTCHLAVDVDNGPAIALYKRFGFVSILKRRALTRALHDGDSGIK